MIKKNKNETVDIRRFCPFCEDDRKVVEKKVSIPVGSEAFVTKLFACEKCGRYALTPEIRDKMDEWGRKLTKNIIEPQPIFSEAVHKYAEELAMQYGLKRVAFFRVLTAFYLSRIVNRDDFEEIKQFCANHVSRKLMEEGKRSKISVPIRYLMYRKLQVFSDVWNIPHAKVIEEAVVFGLTVLSCKEDNFEKLKTIVDSLQQYINDIAQAA